jgi:hypothetical protein
MGSGHPLLVPPRFYSLPDRAENLFNRISAVHCPRNAVCQQGIKYADYVWRSGDCYANSNNDHTSAKIHLSVAESTNNISVGSMQQSSRCLAFVRNCLNIKWMLSIFSIFGTYALDHMSATKFVISSNGSFSQLSVADTLGGLSYK